MIDFKPNIYYPFIEKHNFIDLIKFFKDDTFCKLLARLQILQELEHKLLVSVVIPIISRWLVNVIKVWELENPLKIIQEIFKNKVNEDLLLDIPW